MPDSQSSLFASVQFLVILRYLLPALMVLLVLQALRLVSRELSQFSGLEPAPKVPGLAELVVIQGFDLAPGESFRLSSESVLLGRSATCGLPLNDPAVSMEHAQIARHGNRYFVTDLNSTNGTWVNDQKLTGPTYLVDGDTVAVGDTVFRFQELRTPPPDEHRSYR